MEEAVQELNVYLAHENGRLQELADLLQEKHHIMSQEVQDRKVEATSVDKLIRFLTGMHGSAYTSVQNALSMLFLWGIVKEKITGLKNSGSEEKSCL